MTFGMQTRKFILYNLLNQIVLHDLIEENDAGVFEYKRDWQNRWQQGILPFITIYGGKEQFFLEWEQLKRCVVDWMKHEGNSKEKELLLEECFRFIPYTPLPGWERKDNQKAAISPDARHLALQKISILLGYEETAL
ncbi:MAG: hypothetical protein HPY66_0650 [Firmicutes bacterium]|nr:hypothetical protein [Bacillota bacterium]MDI6706840.1 hypothetical protein [Bacillota bacterium]